MKGMNTCRLFTSAVILVTAVLAGAAEPEVSAKVLSEQMFAQMDADSDGQVSEQEYIDFGTAYLKKKGKRANRNQMLQQFDGFDRDSNGFITTEDPTYKSPVEVLEERISGMWTCEKTKQGPISFVFMEKGKADVIQNGESIRDQAGDVVRYRFVHPKKKPTGLDIVVDQGEGTDFYFKCIFEFISEDQMKMRMETGGEYTLRPKSFPADGGSDTITLVKTAMPEKTPMDDAVVQAGENPQEPGKKPEQNLEPRQDITHAGRLSVICKVEKDSDRNEEETERPNRITGDIVIITTCTKTKSETPALAVTISNNTTHPDAFTLEWYSYATLPGGKNIITNDSGSENITVAARGRCKESITPRTMTLTETTVEIEYANGDVSDPKITETGRIYAGYLMLLKHGDTILDKKASSKNYLTDQWIAGL